MLDRRIKLFLALVSTYLLMSAPSSVSFAQSPVPARKTEALGELKNRIEAKKSQQVELKEKLSASEAELAESRKSLVQLAKDIQENEKSLLALETRITALKTEQETLDRKIKNDYGSMSELVTALQRIRRIPTETLIIRPGAPLETAQTALLLRSVLPAINDRARLMSNDLSRMHEIESSLKNDRQNALESSDKLKAQKKDIEKLVEKRDRLYRATRTDYQLKVEQIARMAAEAENLSQVLARIESTPAPPARHKEKKSSASSKLPGGKWRPPMDGKVISAFGTPDKIGAITKGIKIAGRSGGLVTTPVSGIVRFAGPFRNYGNMVIVEHGSGFHSLMSGLSRLDIPLASKALRRYIMNCGTTAKLLIRLQNFLACHSW